MSETASEQMSHDETTSAWSRQSGPLLGFLSGLLLAMPGILPAWAILQAVAFVPFLVALRRVHRWRECLHTGFLMGLGFVSPQVLLLQLPAVITLILVVYFLALTSVLVAVSWSLVRPVNVWGALAFGAFLAVVDWIAVSALPMWGTAQSFARCWSSYPMVIAFTSITGITGVLFMLGVIQALGVTLVLDRSRRRRCLAALAGVVAIAALVDAAVLTRKPIGYLRVAAVGWVLSREQQGPTTREGFEKLYAGPVAEAARRGARLVVSPETAFAIYDDSGKEGLSDFIRLAREHDVYLAVGYLDAATMMSRVAFVGPAEGFMGSYAKTHLTPFEDYPRGDGEPLMISVDGVSVGAMICHDDNYTDVSRRYGNRAVGVIVVPTNDWGPVRRAHLQSMIHRAIESRFAIVRAASNGISVIISPAGTVIEACDHCREGPNTVIADVPVYSVRSIFSRFGHWFVWVCAGFLMAYIVAGRAISKLQGTGASFRKEAD